MAQNKDFMNDVPRFLYHYTSIGVLTLILKNKEIRFRRLDKVSDADELKVRKFPDAKCFLFASCWTAESEESIPLWNMYSKDMEGVRIKLPINMFKGRSMPNRKTTKRNLIHVGGPAVKIRRGDKTPFRTCNIFGPEKVDYSHDINDLSECFEDYNEDCLKVDLLNIGTIKSKKWYFEKEWRFLIYGMPIEGTWKKEDFNMFFKRPLDEHLDIPLDPSVFEEMEVILGPKTNKSGSIILDLLQKEYAPNLVIYESGIRINQ